MHMQERTTCAQQAWVHGMTSLGARLSHENSNVRTTRATLQACIICYTTPLSSGSGVDEPFRCCISLRAYGD